MAKNVKEQIEAIIQTHKKMIAELEATGIETLISASDMIIQCFNHGRVVYICGNGGSAADAQHIAGELVGRFKKERKALPAIALSTDTSVITSIANDYSFDNIFVRQVEALVKKDDILWAISTSGNSPNVVAAAKSARQKGTKILAFTGQADSKLEELADICFCAASDSTAQSQQLHQIAYHIICDLVEQSIC